MNGAGNAIAIFDARSRAFAPDAAKLRNIASEMKADQIMTIERAATHDAAVRIWNADGSAAEACGNGTRCIAHILMEESGAEKVSIQTDTDILKATRAESGLVTVDMGSPLLGWTDIPLSEDMNVRGIDLKIGPIDDPILARPAVVSMGNPHAVFFVDDVDAYNIPAIGPLVEGHPVFPEGANVGFAQIIDRETIRLRVWERGAGLTKACGSGACAALVCASRARKSERKAAMILDGGTLVIEWRESDDHVLMTGPVELEYEGEI